MRFRDYEPTIEDLLGDDPLRLLLVKQGIGEDEFLARLAALTRHVVERSKHRRDVHCDDFLALVEDFTS
ncbi:MAG: hypothetical protein ACM33T_17690 [Solirubrobacterales bacterium]